MTHITKKMREEMVARAVAKAGIFDRMSKMLERRREFAELARIDALGGYDAAAAIDALMAEEKAFMARVPKVVRTAGEIVRAGSSIKLNIAGMRYWASWEGCRPTPYDHTIAADHPLAQRFLEIEDADRELDGQREQLEAQVRGALGSFTTVKKLLAAWPEAAELLPADSPDKPKPTLPAVPMADLNKLIGLPSA